MEEKRTRLDENTVRVIKIGKEALFEFIYEQFSEHVEAFFDVDALDVINTFKIDFERGEFIFCVSKGEAADGKILPLPGEIDLQQLMKTLPDTTTSMYTRNRYKEFTKEELIALSKKA